jgi:hypothetical protein
MGILPVNLYALEHDVFGRTSIAGNEGTMSHRGRRR